MKVPSVIHANVTVPQHESKLNVALSINYVFMSSFLCGPMYDDNMHMLALIQVTTCM